MRRFVLPALLCALLAACSGGNDGPLEVALIGEADSTYASGLRLSGAAQHLRAAQSVGLVTLDPEGLVAPGLADRWIVTDEGRSYVFRLRDGDWPDGRALTADSVRGVIRDRLRALDGTSLGLDLAPVREVRTMAEGVIEFRLSSPVPDFLQLLAQPEMALTPTGTDSIPMTLYAPPQGQRALDMAAPERRGLPTEDGWRNRVRRIALFVGDSEAATARFKDGEADIVLGGSLSDLPLAEVGPLSRGTVRLDPAIGLFGLHVVRAEGVLGDASTREALSLALDREALIAPFSIGGWVSATSVVPTALTSVPPRWDGIALDARRGTAAARIANFRAGGGSVGPLRVYLPEGPGSDIMFAQLAEQWLAIGVPAQRAADVASADLVLRDRVARFGGARWFLNQFNCSVARGACSQAADALVKQSVGTADDTERRRLLGEAQVQFDATNVFIPLGAPIRWSLVRGDVTGFAGNIWAFHPLPPLAEMPR
ncbi:ABC transporter substrate-binding protein [Altererythrobacter sp. CAU 1778]